MRNTIVGVCILAGVVVALCVLAGGRTSSDPEAMPSGAPHGDDGQPRLVGTGPAPQGRPVERGASSIRGRVTSEGEATSATVNVSLVEPHREVAPGSGPEVDEVVRQLLVGGMGFGAALAVTTTDQDGRFEVTDLAAGRYCVEAVDSRGRSVRSSARIPVPGAVVEVSLDIRRGDEVLRGRVVCSDGSRFVGWVVCDVFGAASADLEFGPNARSVPVGEQGQFVVDGLPVGPIRVTALSSDARIAEVVTLPLEGEYLLRVSMPQSRRTGRVMHEGAGRPIAGAEVLVGQMFSGQRREFRRLRTSASGEFGLPEALGGRLLLTVRARGYVPQVFEFRDRDDVRVECKLKTTITAVGVVLNEATRQPVADVWIYALPMDDGPQHTFPATTRANSEGRFTLRDVAPGTVALFALGNGHATPGLAAAEESGYASLACTLAEGSEDLEILVSEAGRIQGRVVSADGRGVSRALVRVEQTRVWSPVVDQFGVHDSCVFSDEKGQYTVETVVPSAPAVLTVLSPLHAPYRSDSIRVGPGETANEDIVLSSGRWLGLTVLDADGAPVSGAVVSVGWTEELRGGQCVPMRRATDGTGHVRLGPLYPGPVPVAIRAPSGYLDVEPWQELEDSASDDGIETSITLDAALSLSGRVIVPDGAPSSYVQGIVQGYASDRSILEGFAIRADGTWELEGLPKDATLRVSATLDWEGRDWIAEQQVSAGDADVVLRLAAAAPEARIIVRVTDPAGDPVAAGPARMRIAGATGAFSLRTEIAGGRAVFRRTDDLASDAELWIELGPFPDGRLASTVVGPMRGVQSGLIDVRVEAGQLVSGRITNQAGRGVGGVRVLARAARTDLPPGVEDRRGSGTSGPDGSFEIHGLGCEPCVLEVSHPQEYLAPEDVVVSPPQAGTVITLRDALSVRITVFDPAREPVSSAFVACWLDESAAREGERPPNASPESAERLVAGSMTGKSGTAVLAGLDPALTPLRLRVRPPRDRDDLLPSTVDEWSPADSTVHLERGLSITGMVQDRDGRPVPDAEVWARLPTGEDLGASLTDGSGKFRISPLRAGEVTLRVRVGSGPLGPPHTVRAGSTGLVLDVAAR